MNGKAQALLAEIDLVPIALDAYDQRRWVVGYAVLHGWKIDRPNQTQVVCRDDHQDLTVYLEVVDGVLTGEFLEKESV